MCLLTGLLSPLSSLVSDLKWWTVMAGEGPPSQGPHNRLQRAGCPHPGRARHWTEMMGSSYHHIVGMVFSNVTISSDLWSASLCAPQVGELHHYRHALGGEKSNDSLTDLGFVRKHIPPLIERVTRVCHQIPAINCSYIQL